MAFKEDMQFILKEIAYKVELERFMMGMGKYEFAKYLGIHYHTYNSFIKQDRITHPKNIATIAKFLIDKGVDITLLAEKVDKLKNEVINSTKLE